MGPGNEAVYVVDDDRTVREALSALLQANGKEVRMFNSETEFLSIERKDGAACLILDLKMPGMNGLEVQRFVSERVLIPIIFITGSGDISSTVKAMRCCRLPHEAY